MRDVARLRWIGTGAVLLALAVLGGCRVPGHRMTEEEAAALTQGDPRHGKVVIRKYGCGSCHNIPGIPGANSLVGPPLDAVAERAYIAGVLTNTPDHMIQWIKDPRRVDDKTAMPTLGLSDQEARDVAAYLYMLR